MPRLPFSTFLYPSILYFVPSSCPRSYPYHPSMMPSVHQLASVTGDLCDTTGNPLTLDAVQALVSSLLQKTNPSANTVAPHDMQIKEEYDQDQDDQDQDHDDSLSSRSSRSMSPSSSLKRSPSESSVTATKKPRKKKAKTEEEKEERAKERVLRNRFAAQQSRDRKRRHMESLKEDNDQLRKENSQLAKRVKSIESENMSLHRKLDFISNQLASLNKTSNVEDVCSSARRASLQRKRRCFGSTDVNSRSLPRTSSTMQASLVQKPSPMVQTFPKARNSSSSSKPRTLCLINSSPRLLPSSSLSPSVPEITLVMNALVSIITTCLAVHATTRWLMHRSMLFYNSWTALSILTPRLSSLERRLCKQTLARALLLLPESQVSPWSLIRSTNSQFPVHETRASWLEQVMTLIKLGETTPVTV